jgi:hypothetical protein
MRKTLFVALVASLVLAGSGSGFCQDSEGPLGDPIPPAVQDPSLSTSRYFKPSLTTAGVADMGPTLGSSKKVSAGHQGIACSVTNPCAVPSPALDRAVAARAS